MNKMDEVILVTDDNCISVAREIVARLQKKTFSIQSVETNIKPRPKFKKISGLRLYDDGPIPGFDPQLGYHFESGNLTIPISPKRKIQWNMITERVFVTFHEDGRITIEKSFLNAIFYSMIISVDIV